MSYTSAPCNSTQGGVGYLLCNGDMVVTTNLSGSSVTVNAWGTPDYGVYPHMQVWVNGNLIGEWDVTGSAQNYSASTTVPGNVTTYQHLDHLSTRLITNSSGGVVEQKGHFPYGETWYEGSTNPSKLKFTSYERDAESGNDYAIFRTYVNRLGRFNRPDPIAGSVGVPQSLNRYTFVRNDPVNLVDPLGLTDVSAFIPLGTPRLADTTIHVNERVDAIKLDPQSYFGKPGGGAMANRMFFLNALWAEWAEQQAFRPHGIELAKRLLANPDCAAFILETVLKAATIANEGQSLGKQGEDYIKGLASPSNIGETLDNAKYNSRIGQGNPNTSGKHTTLASVQPDGSITLWGPFFDPKVMEFSTQVAQALLHEGVHAAVLHLSDRQLAEAATGKKFPDTREGRGDASNAFHEKLREKCNKPK